MIWPSIAFKRPVLKYSPMITAYAASTTPKDSAAVPPLQLSAVVKQHQEAQNYGFTFPRCSAIIALKKHTLFMLALLVRHSGNRTLLGGLLFVYQKEKVRFKQAYKMGLSVQRQCFRMFFHFVQKFPVTESLFLAKRQTIAKSCRHQGAGSPCLEVFLCVWTNI